MLDVHTAPRLQAVLDGVIDAGVAQLVVDLGGLEFMDSVTPDLPGAQSETARAAVGFRVAFVPRPPAVQRVFELSVIASVLDFCESLPDDSPCETGHQRAGNV
jgi:anti-anti-sigma factor